MIYMARCGDNGPVKIGLSGNPEARLIELQTAHFVPLHIVRVLAGGRGVEKWLHDHFAAHHIRSEWFHFQPEMLTIQPGAHADLARLGREFAEIKDRLIEMLNRKPVPSHKFMSEALDIPLTRLGNWICVVRRMNLAPEGRQGRRKRGIA
jgi:hypothetical protein